MLYRQIVDQVHQVISSTVMEELFSHLFNQFKRGNVKLWGQNKGRGFVRKCIYVAFYRDIKGTSYNQLASECKSWMQLPGPSISHNTKSIRRVLHDYFLNQMSTGTVGEWDRRAKKINMREDFRDVNLWIDSTDFPLVGKRSSSTSNLFWSYKLNKLGLRFMAIIDGKGEIRFLSPGYTPKLYDGHWLEMNRRLLEEKFAGSTIIGDTHFEKGEHLFKNLSFKTPIPESRAKKRRADGVEVPQHNQATQSYNNEHKRIRSRVELPFARLDQMFKTLSEPFNEGEEQLEYLVMIGCGCLNKMMQ